MTLQGLHAQLPSGAWTNRDLLPTFCGLSRRPFVHSLASTLRLQAGRLLAAAPFPLRHAGIRIFQVDALVSVHLGHEHFAMILQATQKSRLLAIPTIDTHPTKTHTDLAGMYHHLECQIRLAFQNHLGLRNTRRLTSLHVLRPFFGKVQTDVDQG
jgi:hypothetical protein